MKITIESTPKFVTLVVNGADVPARVWQGASESGIPVHVFITRIVPEVPKSDPRIDELTSEFERDLKRCPDIDMRRTVEAIPLRFFID